MIEATLDHAHDEDFTQPLTSKSGISYMEHAKPVLLTTALWSFVTITNAQVPALQNIDHLSRLECSSQDPSALTCSDSGSSEVFSIKTRWAATPKYPEKINKPDCQPPVLHQKFQDNILQITGNLDCKVPARLCLDVRIAQDPVNAFPISGIIDLPNGSLSIQGNHRLSTSLKNGGKAATLCTDPNGSTKESWQVDIRYGEKYAVKKSLWDARPFIEDGSGRMVSTPKSASEIKQGYLFIDLDEKNQDQLIPLIRKSGFPYLLIYSWTWSKSLGSYPLNTNRYPNGLNGLSSVTKRLKESGIKTGLHTLTSFISKYDPYINTGKPDHRILFDAYSSLAQSATAESSTLTAEDSLEDFPSNPAFYGDHKSGTDILIDDEIISCPTVIIQKNGRLADCRRGLYGTKQIAHAKGAKIAHIAERYGSYLADLTTSMKDEVANRIASVINDAGIDMLYFDGGEINSANPEADWYLAEQQLAILRKIRRPVLVEGSGNNARLWPFMNRMVADDFAALAPIAYLDVHKVGRIYKRYVQNMMPANLGWLAILPSTSAYPATTPEEISTYVARSLALDVPLAIETTHDNLIKNHYSEALLDALGAGNKAIGAGELPPSSKSKLLTGNWYYTKDPVPMLRQASLNFMSTPVSSWRKSGNFQATQEEDGAFLRISNIRHHTSSPAPSETIPIMMEGELRLNPIRITDKNRGELVKSIPLGAYKSDIEGSSYIDFQENAKNKTALDLTTSRIMQITYAAEPLERTEGERKQSTDKACTNVLNFQLEDNRGSYRDYFLHINPSEQKSIVLDPGASAEEMLRQYSPAGKSYAFKAAIYSFNFAAITKINLRWMETCQDHYAVVIKSITMLKELPDQIINLGLKIDGTSYPIAHRLSSGETLDVYPDGQLQICDEKTCQTSTINWPAGEKLSGKKIQLEGQGAAEAAVTLGLLSTRVEIEPRHMIPRGPASIYQLP